MSRLFLVITAALAFVLGLTTDAIAQPTEHRVYATGGVTASYVSEGGDPPGGWTRELSLGIGKSFGDGQISVEGDLSRGGVMEKLFTSLGGRPVLDSRRDWLFGANFRFHHAKALTGANRLEPLVGVGLYEYQFWRQPVRLTSPVGTLPVMYQLTGTRQSDRLNGIYAMAGFEGRIGGSRFAILPSFRGYLRAEPGGLRDMYLFSSSDLEWSGLAVSLGVKAQVNF